MKKNKKVIGKWIAIAAAAVIVQAAVTGCGADTQSEVQKETAAGAAADTQAAETQATETAADDTFALNETAVFPNLKITATELKESTGDDFAQPADGNVFVGIKFKIENVSDEDQIISSMLLFDAYADKTKADYELMQPSDLSGEMLDGTLGSGMNMEGYYIIQAKQDWQEIELQVKSEWLSDSSAKFVLNK